MTARTSTWWATTWSPTGPRSPRTGRRGRPISEYAVEAVVDELAEATGMDPIEFRLKNAAREGTKAAYGPRFGPVGLVKTLDTAKASEHYRTPLGPTQGRGVASGFWFNIGARPARRCTSARTAPSPSSPAPRTSAARAPRSP